MWIYYCVTILANVIFAVVFCKSINLTLLSVLPLALIVLMIFQALMLKNEKAELGFKTAYASNLTADEENKMASTTSAFLFATIPWIIPFIIFFSSPIKTISIIVYIIGLISGGIFYRIKNKDEIKKRMDEESKQRSEQEKKEELGRWK